MAIGQIDAFMDALSGQESSGNPEARNPQSGAYGEWQIMPSNWPSWAQEAGLTRSAPQTAENQRTVARFKMTQYYRQYGSWEAVAVAWFAGPDRARRYVAGDKSVLSLSDGNMTVGEYIDKMRSGMGNMARRAEDDADPGTTEPEPVENDDDQALFDLFGAVSDQISRTNNPFGDDESGLAAFFKNMSAAAEEQTAQYATGTVSAPPPPGTRISDDGTVESADANRGGGPGQVDVEGDWDADEVLGWAEQVAESFGAQITSHERSEAENEAVGGADNSDHLWGGGIDFGGEREAELALYRWLKPFEGKGAIRLVLDEGDHIHVSFVRGSSAAAPSPMGAAA